MNQRQSFLDSRPNVIINKRNEQFDDLNDLFNKKFQFRHNSEWKLPPVESWFSAPPWEVKKLQTLKAHLNFHKSQLNDFNLEEWSSHTRRRNPAGEVSWRVRSLVNPEFLTQAWTKFYECACTYNIVPKRVEVSKEMVSFHLCEAPGAFITSLNHYLKSNYRDIDWKWLATTLNPYYEGNSLSNMISDDRFMFHTLDNWDFGSDNTGNLMDWDNSQAMLKRAKSLGKVLLVTADGSIDCLQKPDAQEEVTSPLHYCEIITALQALSEGGTFIFKLFTIFEHSTVSLLYLVNQLFSEVNIYKPVTSRQGNSEVYAICLNYMGCGTLEPSIAILKSAYGSEIYKDLSLFPREKIPDSFLMQVVECAEYFSSIQCQVINNNLEAYLLQNSIALHNHVKKIRGLVADAFIRIYGLKSLYYDQEIMNGALHKESKMNMNPRYHRGSYTERQLYTKISLKDKIKSLQSFLNSDVFCNPSIFVKQQVSWMTFYDPDYNLKIRFIYGYPVHKINSSKFIFVPIFKLHQQIMEEEEFKEIIVNNEAKVKNEPFSNSDAGIVLIMPNYDYTESYNVFEKKSFKYLADKLKDLALGSTICLRNFNLLTHFNVSVLFILSKVCFERTGFSNDGIIHLNNLMNKDYMILFLELIESECLKCYSSKDVLSTLPIDKVYDGQFFSNIVFYNNTVYRNKCIKNLNFIEQLV